MARTPTAQSISDVINDSVRAAVARVLPSLQRAFNAAVEARVRAEVATGSARSGPGRPSRRAGEIIRWVADNRARRVPNFVIEATGLDTKKKIVARYGTNAAFAKGKVLPPVRLEAAKAAEQDHKTVVKAKPPVIRKAAATRT
jgi:hypothetical protein